MGVVLLGAVRQGYVRGWYSVSDGAETRTRLGFVVFSKGGMLKYL